MITIWIIYHTFKQISACGCSTANNHYLAFIAGDNVCSLSTNFLCHVFYSSNKTVAEDIISSMAAGFRRTHHAAWEDLLLILKLLSLRGLSQSISCQNFIVWHVVRFHNTHYKNVNYYEYNNHKVSLLKMSKCCNDEYGYRNSIHSN